MNHLALENKLKQDELIRFDAEGHKYSCWNAYVEREIMSSDPEWPMESVTSLIGYFFHDNFVFISKRILQSKGHLEKINDKKYKYYQCKSEEEIRKIWLKSADLGTLMHGHFEIMANLIETDRINKSAMFHEYIEANLQGYVHVESFYGFMEYFGINDGKNIFFRTELKLYCESINVSGTIDGLLRDTISGEYIMFDWKRSKCVKEPPEHSRAKSKFAWGRYIESVKKIKNCGYCKYALQQHMYRWLLYKIHGIRVNRLYLIVINPEKDPHDALEIKELPLAPYEDAVKDIFGLRAMQFLESRDLKEQHRDALEEIYRDSNLQ